MGGSVMGGSTVMPKIHNRLSSKRVKFNDM